MSDKKCEDCLFYEGFSDATGVCRRYPPQQYYMPESDRIDAAPPATTPYGWCGEWKSKTQEETDERESG